MSESLLDHLVRRFPTAKKQTLRRMVEDRRVRIDGKPAHNVKQPVEPTQSITIDDRPKPIGPESIPPPFPIVFEDADLLVIDKPAGLLTSTVPHERRPTALALVREYVARREPAARVGLIHRLDRDASGLLVFSKITSPFDRSSSSSSSTRSIAFTPRSFTAGSTPPAAAFARGWLNCPMAPSARPIGRIMAKRRSASSRCFARVRVCRWCASR